MNAISPVAGRVDTVRLSSPEKIPDYRFAWKYTTEDIFTKADEAAAFLDDYLVHEAKFFEVARDPESGLSFDGVDLDPETGEMTAVRGFSAASKECLDLGLCIKALYGDPLVGRVVCPEDPARAPEVAAEILGRKVESYNRFLQEYPGFNGYFTWFHSGERAAPVEGWSKSFPTLDLGEMMWATLLAEKALRDTGRPELASKYASYNETMQSRAVDAIYDPQWRRVRGHVDVHDPSDPATSYGGQWPMTGEHGVHEGQMMILYMDLFTDLPASVKNEIWDDIEMVRLERDTGTTWQGFWASPHEEWAYLFLPYRDHSGFRDLFEIREKVRTQNAFERGYPGLSASAHHPSKPQYMSAAGIEEVGSQPILHNDTYTVYGAFPLLLQFAGELTGNVGLAWLHNMLLGPRMQGPMGAGESGDNEGTSVAHVKTIDASFTNILAMAGGLEKEMADLLKERGVYDDFMARMGGEYDETFGDAPLRDPGGFALPPAPAPAASPEYFRGPDGEPVFRPPLPQP